jgi:hypothetical protein
MGVSEDALVHDGDLHASPPKPLRILAGSLSRGVGPDDVN